MAVTFAIASALVLLIPSQASAQGYCSQSLPGWRIVPPSTESDRPPFFPRAANGTRDTGAEVVVWGRLVGSTAQFIVQFRNLRANGKYALLGRVGRADNRSDLGITSSIGTAGSRSAGAWCSNIHTGNYIWSSLSYRIRGVVYSAQVSGFVTIVRR
jgi:hypothetical protein